MRSRCSWGSWSIRSGRTRWMCKIEYSAFARPSRGGYTGSVHAHRLLVPAPVSQSRPSIPRGLATQLAAVLRCGGFDPACLPPQDSFACPTISQPKEIIHGCQATKVCLECTPELPRLSCMRRSPYGTSHATEARTAGMRTCYEVSLVDLSFHTP